jgi:hypothetical protein
MSWTFPWASSFGNDFNNDFKISFTDEEQREGRIEYNYHREAAWQTRSGEGMATHMEGTPVGDNAAATGTDVATYTRERPGMSAFALEDGIVYHTYSAFARGLDAIWGMYQWLDRAPRGRNESEGVWWRRHDGTIARPSARAHQKNAVLDRCACCRINAAFHCATERLIYAPASNVVIGANFLQILWRMESRIHLAMNPCRSLLSLFAQLRSPPAYPQRLISVTQCAAKWKCPAAGRCP